jgi:hypothetical protein
MISSAVDRIEKNLERIEKKLDTEIATREFLGKGDP